MTDIGQKIILLLIFGLKQKCVVNFIVFLKTLDGLTAKNIISGFYKKYFTSANWKKTLSNLCYFCLVFTVHLLLFNVVVSILAPT